MINDPEFNLVNVYGQIERFKSSFISQIKAFLHITPKLDYVDKNSLEEIQSRIKLIEINQQAYSIDQKAKSPKAQKPKSPKAQKPKSPKAPKPQRKINSRGLVATG